MKNTKISLHRTLAVASITALLSACSGGASSDEQVPAAAVTYRVSVVSVQGKSRNTQQAVVIDNLAIQGDVITVQ